MITATIRPGDRDDLAALVRLYNHYVTASHVTFDVEPLSVADREAWLAGFADDGPHRLFVAEIDGRLAGYATSGPLRPKPAYRSSVEVTVYTDPQHTGQGIGRRLLETLLAALEREPGVHRAYAAIALPNPASIALFERSGFRRVGTFHQVGRKLGKYWDVGWYERSV